MATYSTRPMARLLKRKRQTRYGVPGTLTTYKVRARRPYLAGRDRRVGFYGRFTGRNAELKFHNVTFDDPVVAAGGTVIAAGSIHLIPQGVTEIQRIGRKCTIRSIEWRYTVTLPTQDAVAVPITGDSLRIIFYIDRQANGATATVSGADGLLIAGNIHSHKDLANVGRFEILKDELINMNYIGQSSDGAGLTSQGSVVRNYHWYKKCNVNLEFSGVTGALTELRSNNIGVMLISNSGIIGLTSEFRIRFSDQSG